MLAHNNHPGGLPPMGENNLTPGHGHEACSPVPENPLNRILFCFSEIQAVGSTLFRGSFKGVGKNVPVGWYALV